MSEGYCVSLQHHCHHHHYSSMGDLSPFPLKECTDVWWVSKKTLCSAFIFNFSDWWNQTTSGFVLVDLVGHVSAHGLDLNVPGVGIFWFICKPFLFWRGQGERGRREGRVSLKYYATRAYEQPYCLSLSDRFAWHSLWLASNCVVQFKCVFSAVSQFECHGGID